MMTRRDFLADCLAALAAQFLTLHCVFAQSRYPERPIRLVVPFPPGGGYDAVARPWAERIKPLLGTIVIENMGGGGLGAAAVALVVAGVRRRPGLLLSGNRQSV